MNNTIMTLTLLKKSCYYLFIVLIILLFDLNIYAQDLSEYGEVDTIDAYFDESEQLALFQKGVDLYNMERYWDALHVFNKVNSIPLSENHFISSSNLMLMRTYLRLGDIERSILLGHEFESFYKESEYLDDVQYTMGEAFFRQGQYTDALLYFLSVMKITDDERLRRLSKETLETIIDLFLSAEEVENLKEKIEDKFNEVVLSLNLAEKYHSTGEYKRASKEIRSVRGLVKDAFLEDEYMKIKNQVESRPTQKVYIGVVLPLSGPMSGVGEKILNGVRYALHQFRLRSDIDVSAIVLDNRGDVIQSIKQVEYLSKNPKVIAIFGPVSSDNAIPMAALANQYKIPMITPTATNSELSSLGPYVFQANVDFENLGRFLGIYCASVSGIKTVASLSPADEYGKDMTDSFCEAVDELGGRIVTQQWYIGKPEELRFQLKNIRQVGLELMHDQLAEKIRLTLNHLRRLAVSDTAWWLDSLYLSVGESDCQLFSEDTVYILSHQQALIFAGLMDSLEFEIPIKDSIEFRINSINGLLLPSHATDLNMIVPQLEYYNLKTMMFGSGNWNDLSFLKKNQRFLNGLKFVSDYYIDTESIQYKNFESYYARLIGYKPSRFDLYGYDTMMAVLSNFGTGEITRKEIRKKLSLMPTYHGICRNISFKGNRPRVNSCAFILSFDKGLIRPAAIIENGDLIPVTK